MIYIGLIETPKNKRESLLIVSDTTNEAELYASSRGRVLDLRVLTYENRRLARGVIAANSLEYCPYYGISIPSQPPRNRA